MRTASEKLRNRSSFSTNVVYTTPGTRVNRYISRLLEARQTELEMADLNFFTLKYKHVEREQKVSDLGTLSLSLSLWRSSDGLINIWFSLSLCAHPMLSFPTPSLPSSTVPPASGRVLHQRRCPRPHPGCLIWAHLPSGNPTVSAVPMLINDMEP